MPTSNGMSSSALSFTTAYSHLSTPIASQVLSAPQKIAKVVGLYGVPATGKTYLLNQLKHKLGEEDFTFYESSKQIGSLLEGGLKAFEKLEDSKKDDLRMRAIDKIKKETEASMKIAIVAGHLTLWPEGEVRKEVYTQADLNTYTHILYLDVAPEVVEKWNKEDKGRVRRDLSKDQIREWQEAEKTLLRRLCQNNGILLALVSPRPTMFERVEMLLRDFQYHDEERNTMRAENELAMSVAAGQGKLRVMLVMDADKTLAAEDTGKLFWNLLCGPLPKEDDPLRNLFSSPLKYSHAAFRQATLMYEEAADDDEFDGLCEMVASQVHMHPEFISLLQLVAEADHVGAVVVTCGLRLIWEKVLEREGLADTVKVIGGGRLADDLIVTSDVKAGIVTRLKEFHQKHVCAFGDGPLDLDMLKKADRAIVVVGEEQKRSQSMDAALKIEIDRGLRASQVLLPRGQKVSVRLDCTMLPETDLTGQEFVDTIFKRPDPTDRPDQPKSHRPLRLHVLTTEDNGAAKLLMTPMRDAAVAGLELREAHRRIGRYLATKYLSTIIGLEEYPICDVLSRPTSGFRLLHEDKTLILALMRGGEPMASGVNDVFPLAMFFHAKITKDLTMEQLKGRQTVVMVDSVVNTGKSILEFVQRVRELHATIRIVVVAGVIQAEFPTTGGLDDSANLSVVALRLSATKFKGEGTTDTGNRLFNTTHLK